MKDRSAVKVGIAAFVISLGLMLGILSPWIWPSTQIEEPSASPSPEVQAIQPNIKLLAGCDKQVAELLVPGDREAISEAVKVQVNDHSDNTCDISFALSPDAKALSYGTDIFMNVVPRYHPAGQRFTARPAKGVTVVVLVQYAKLWPGSEQVAINKPPGYISEGIFGT